MAVNANNVLYLAAGMFGLAPSKSLLDVFKAFEGNDAQFAAAVGTLPYTAQFYAGNNQAKAAKLVDMLGGKLLAADMKAAATGYIVGLLSANGGNVGSAAAEVIKFVLNSADPALAAVKTQLMNRQEVAKAYSEKVAEGLDLALVGTVTNKTETKDAAIQKIGGAGVGQTFEMTREEETINGTDGNDTINATAFTFGADDAVIDKSDKDEDVLNLKQAAHQVKAVNVEGVETINVSELVSVGFNAENVKGANTLNLNTEENVGAAVTVSNVAAAAVKKVVAGENVASLTVTALADGTEGEVAVVLDKQAAATVNGGAGDDTFNVTLGAATKTLSIAGGAGDDVAEVTLAGGAVTLNTSGAALEKLTLKNDMAASSVVLAGFGVDAAEEGEPNGFFLTGSKDVRFSIADALTLNGKTLDKSGFSGKVSLTAGNVSDNADLSQFNVDNVVLKAAAATKVTTVADGAFVHVAGNANGHTVQLGAESAGVLKTSLEVKDTAPSGTLTFGNQIKELHLSSMKTSDVNDGIAGANAIAADSVTTLKIDALGGNTKVLELKSVKTAENSLIFAKGFKGGELKMTLADGVAGVTVLAAEDASATTTLTLGNKAAKVLGDTAQGAVNVTVAAGAEAHTIKTGAGNDTINLNNNTGTLEAGAGNDMITVGGAAQVDAGAGNDVISVTAAATVRGGEGNDVIEVSTAAATIYGDAGNDIITSATASTILGGDGDDVITTKGGVVNAGAGGDRIVLDSTVATTVTGGAGSDHYVLNGGMSATITIKDFEVGKGGDRIELFIGQNLLEQYNESDKNYKAWDFAAIDANRESDGNFTEGKLKNVVIYAEKTQDLTQLNINAAISDTGNLKGVLAYDKEAGVLKHSQASGDTATFGAGTAIAYIGKDLSYEQIQDFVKYNLVITGAPDAAA